jgi:hypothetical protein
MNHLLWTLIASVYDGEPPCMLEDPRQFGHGGNGIWWVALIGGILLTYTMYQWTQREAISRRADLLQAELDYLQKRLNQEAK